VDLHILCNAQGFQRKLATTDWEMIREWPQVTWRLQAEVGVATCSVNTKDSRTEDKSFAEKSGKLGHRPVAKDIHSFIHFFNISK